jgi:predicted nucleic acid-binding protein
VIIEIANALAKAHLRGGAIVLLDAMEADPHVEIIPVSEELYAEGAKLYRGRQDKEWGMTDCISFAVMHDRGMQDALTADDHFRQAGFRALLHEQ